MALQNLILPIVSLFRSAGINQARNALGGLNKQYDSLGKTIGSAVGAMAGFNALQTAQQFTVQAVESTQLFERNLLALNQVFEEAKPQIVAFTKEVENYGIGQSRAAQASVFLGSVLKQYGFTTSEAAGQTQRLVMLAQDLATTYGYDVQEALLAITALFRGEYDPIEKFGVAMKQNEINAERVARGLGDLTGAAQMQADAQIRLELLFERATDSVGAYGRAVDTLYGSQQRLNAVMENLQVAAGAPLQEPLANINNILADVAQDVGPQIVEIFDAMGQTLDTIAPYIEKAATFFGNLIAPLQQVINILNGVLAPLLNLTLAPALNLINSALQMFNALLDDISVQFQIAELGFKRMAKAMEGTPLEGIVEGFQWFIDKGAGVGWIFDKITTAIEDSTKAYQVTLGIFPEIEAGNRQASASARQAGYDARDAQEKLDNMAAANDAWSKSYMAKAAHYAEQNGLLLADLMQSSFVTGVETTGGTDYVGDFFRSIDDAVAKESARIKLTAMGASEGLIEAILGSSGWEQVFKRILRDGIPGLQKLQSEFNKTAAGIDEMTKSLEDAAAAQKALQDAAQKMIDDNIARLQAEYDEAERYFNQVQQRAEEFKRWSLNNIATVQILPNFEAELGKFEASIISTIDNIQSQLISALQSDLIFDSDFSALQKWVDTESAALMEVARRRDELASRYALSESLIKEYQAAIAGSLRLTSIFGKLKDETEKRTVTEVTEGVVRLGSSMREFGVIVSRSYEETIQGVTDKTEGLLQGFRDIAQRARDFATNLQKLRDMGLDPMLFNQLVQAGAEAGGETAQAIIDGGQDSVDELNGIFNEINQLGAELGMDVGQTMYEAGQDITYGLLDGIKSEQEQLYELATEMARTFSETFKNNFSLAIDAPVAAAEKAMNDAGASLEKAKEANVDALAEINALIAGAEKALAGPLKSSYVAGVTEKLGIFKDLQSQIISGDVTSLGDLTSGLSTADVRDIAAGLTGSTVSNTFNVNVNADTRAGGTKAGEATVEVLKSYTDNNGGLSTWVTV